MFNVQLCGAAFGINDNNFVSLQRAEQSDHFDYNCYDFLARQLL